MSARSGLEWVPATGADHRGPSGKERKKVVLVSLDWVRARDTDLSLGHASLLAALGRLPDVDSVSVRLPANEPQLTADECVRSIFEQIGEPGVETDVAIGAYVWNEGLLQRVLAEMRQRGYTGRIILGGPQITYAQTNLDTLYPQVDLFIRGDAEDALCAVARGDDPRGVRGVHVRGDCDRVEFAVADLTRAPSPYIDGTLDASSGTIARIETVRGCPYRCSYCQYPRPGLRAVPQPIPEERIFEEIQRLTRAGVERVSILDPVFNSSGRSTRILTEFRRAGFRGRIHFHGRFEALTESFIEACHGLDVFPEFGLQSIHPAECRAVRRGMNLRRIEHAIGVLHRRGIPFEVSLIYGLPLQTLDTFMETVEFCLRMRIPEIRAFPLLLQRGTALETERWRWDFEVEHTPLPVVVSSRSFSRTDHDGMSRIATALEQTLGGHPTSMEGLRRHTSAPLLLGSSGALRRRNIRCDASADSFACDHNKSSMIN